MNFINKQKIKYQSIIVFECRDWHCQRTCGHGAVKQKRTKYKISYIMSKIRMRRLGELLKIAIDSFRIRNSENIFKFAVEKVAPTCFIIGASMELFMVKTGLDIFFSFNSTNYVLHKFFLLVSMYCRLL